MTRSKTGSPKARTLGAELRITREQTGVGVRELARRLNTAHAWVSRTEAGSRIASTEDVTAISVALGISSDERERLVKIAREEDGPDWLRTGIPGVHEELVTLLQYERTAITITEVAPLLIPGLLQTSDYTRAVMTDLTSAELETRVAMRASRRDILTRRKAPSFEALILEQAFVPIVEPEAMVDQLKHLEKLSELPNVAIRVIPSTPARWTPAHSGQFMMLEFDKATPIVHLEHLEPAAFLTSDEAVHTYDRALDDLRAAAMSSTQTLDFIASQIASTEGKIR